MSVWAAIDVDTFDIAHVEVSPARSELDAFLFLNTVVARYRGDPSYSQISVRGTTGHSTISIYRVDHAETWGEWCSSKAGFLSKYPTMLFSSGFHATVNGNIQSNGRKHLQPFTTPSAPVATLPTTSFFVRRDISGVMGVDTEYTGGTAQFRIILFAVGVILAIAALSVVTAAVL